MTTEALDTAVERIVSDPELARRLYEGDAGVDAAGLGLDPGELERGRAALVADVDASSGEVTGFDAGAWPNIEFTQLSALTSTAKRAGGKVSPGEIVITKTVDKSSPGL